MKRLSIFDGHNETLWQVYYQDLGGGRSFFERSERGHIDLPRSREGGFAGGFFAVFVRADSKEADCCATEGGFETPYAPAIDPIYAQRTAMAVTAALFRLEEEAIDPKLDALEVFYRAGLRSLGLVWSRPNVFASGVPCKFPHSPDTGPGLTDAGKELVRACNRLGILIDLSHLNEQGFWDVARLSDAPLVATHSNVHALCPRTRNLTDRQLDAIRESDGMVGLNFGVGMLS